MVPAAGSALGAWLGAIPLCLDWEQPWQVSRLVSSHVCTRVATNLIPFPPLLFFLCLDYLPESQAVLLLLYFALCLMVSHVFVLLAPFCYYVFVFSRGGRCRCARADFWGSRWGACCCWARRRRRSFAEISRFGEEATSEHEGARDTIIEGRV